MLETDRYRTMFENSLDAIFIMQDGVIKSPNAATLALIGYTEKELEETSFDRLIYHEDREMVVDRYRRRMAGEPVPSIYNLRVVTKPGVVLWIEAYISLISWEGRTAGLYFVRDVTTRDRHDHPGEERDASKVLDGILTICAACKKIRDEDGAWHHIEEYIRGRSLADFSHGICPACTDALYPEYGTEPGS